MLSYSKYFVAIGFITGQIAAQSLVVPNREIVIQGCDLSPSADRPTYYEGTVVVFSSGGSVPFVTATDRFTPWAQVAQSSGTATTNGTRITVRVVRQQLRLGLQQAYIAVAPQSNTSQQILMRVTVDCIPTSTIAFEQKVLSVRAESRSAPTTVRVRFSTNQGAFLPPNDGVVRFSVASNVATGPANWLDMASFPGRIGTSNSGSLRLGQSDYFYLTINPANAAPGTYNGSVVAQDTQALAGSAILAVELTVTPASATLQVPLQPIVFTAQAGGPSPAPRTLRVTSTGAALSARAYPRLDSGSWLSVNGSTAPVDFQAPFDLSVAVNTTGMVPGTYRGSILIDPGSNIVPIEVVVTQSGRPSISGNGVQNGASFGPVISPGAWVTIKGDNLAPDTTANGRIWRDAEIVGGRLPTSLDDVRVTIDGKPAFVYFVSNGQINVQAPSDIGLGNSVPVVVTNARGSSTAALANVQSVAPAFFVLNTARSVAARHATDYVIAGDPALFGGAARPARPGDTILLYGTGFGRAEPDTAAGTIVTGAGTLPQAARIGIAGRSPTSVAGYLVGSGLYQFAFTIPSDLQNGDHAIVVEYGGARTQEGVLLHVRR